MAENTPAKAPPKGKGGSLLKKKVAGIPVPVLLVVGGLALFWVYKKYEGNKSSTSSTATPTASTGTADGTDGGYQGGGGGGGQYQPPTTSTTPSGTDASTTPTTTSSVSPSITPLGTKSLNINGESFQGVSSFLDNANNTTYYGIDNPTEAKKLEAMGATLVHNPNDPNGKGLFLAVPAGESATQVVNAKGTAFTNAQNAADTKKAVVTGDKTGTGSDFTGTGSTGSSKTAAQVAAEKAAAEKAAKAKAAQEAEARKQATAKVKARG